MARRLKTYQTSSGFFDVAIAAPSMKAAAGLNAAAQPPLLDCYWTTPMKSLGSPSLIGFTEAVIPRNSLDGRMVKALRGMGLLDGTMRQRECAQVVKFPHAGKGTRPEAASVTTKTEPAPDGALRPSLMET
jgi:hypothetical protein